MNRELLLKHFDRISDAPDAIPRLRQFILDLAVRGKLVEQDPNDEPVAVFLKRIDEHSAQSGRGHEAKNAKDSPQLGSASFVIPTTWRWVSFGRVVVSRDSERVPVSKEERSSRPKVFDYYGASGIIDKIDAFLFDKPLLLIGEDGANLVNRSTPIAFIARGQYWVNNHAHVLDGLSEAFLHYLALHINAIDLKPYVTGTAQPKMNQAKMNSIPIALPPEPEQKRIISKVDELMALCDRLEATQTEREKRRDWLASASLHHLKRVADPDDVREHARFYLSHVQILTTRTEHIEQIRRTILNLAVRGKLVEQDPSDEPTSQLLGRIQAEKAALLNAGGLRKEKPLNGFAEDELPFHIPKNWLWTQLAEIGFLNPRNSANDTLQASFVPMPSISAEYPFVPISVRHF